MKKSLILMMSITICTTTAVSAEWGIKTETTAGFNSKTDTAGYIVGETGISFSHDIGGGFSLKLKDNIEYEHYHSIENPEHPDNVYKNMLSLGVHSKKISSALYYGKLGKKKGASYVHYNKLDGMKYKMSKYKDKYDSASWLNKFYDFKFGYSIRNLDSDENTWSLGAAYENNGWTFGVGYDNEGWKQAEAVGVSIEHEHKMDDVKNVYSISYLERLNSEASSLGLGIESELNEDLTLLGNFAYNNLKNDEKSHYFGAGFEYKSFTFEAGITHEENERIYEASVEYESDVAEVEAEIEFTDEGNSEASLETKYTFNAISPEGMTVLAGLSYERDEDEETGAYVAAEFGITKELTLGVSHSEFHESGPNDYLLGTSLYLRAEF